MKPSPLPPAPPGLVLNGAPATGCYAGQLDLGFDWRGLQPPHARGWLWRRLHHKRWLYLGLGDERVFIGLAVVDVGWTATAFAYLFDRQQARLRVDWSQDGLPGLQAHVADAPFAAGSVTRFRGPGARITLSRDSGQLMQVQLDTPQFQLEAQLDLAHMAPPLLAIGPIADGGVAHATLKTSALPLRGQARLRGAAGHEDLSLDQAWGALDASNGLLARHTAWRWASAHGPGLGFNLQQGYFGGQENALWLDGQLIPLGAAQFAFDAARPLQPWHVRTDDGLLDLQFQPEGARQDARHLGFAASHYVQPVGRFSGWVRASPNGPKREVHQLLGVTEDHRSMW
ncbi:DUF2804 domain-containing protein [Kinneretia aquatilis]|uniref:DUF2804 domain-containing protein n=1 Tax=Kinneretia aquatilis TaxID=2070761 RepID=UPI0014950BAC|nr:DUF2804 domain-containing protein [Paucibacter aquatile]WIV96302.1 DUF2804 domain-containing protein [Paucibacter aquatile]